jgi:hypothetical protein
MSLQLSLVRKIYRLSNGKFFPYRQTMTETLEMTLMKDQVVYVLIKLDIDKIVEVLWRFDCSVSETWEC